MPEVNSALNHITTLIQGIGLTLAILVLVYLGFRAIFGGVLGLIALMTGVAAVVGGLLVAFLAGPIGRALAGSIGAPQALVMFLPWS